MSYQGSITNLLRKDNADIILARIGLVACVLLLGLRLLAEQVLLVVIPLAGGGACALYLVTRRKEAQRHEFVALRTTLLGYLPTAVFLTLAALVLSIHLSGGRTIISHVLTGLIGVFLLAQVLLTEDKKLNPRLVIAQLLIASIVIRFGALFGTPGFTGVDIWTHVPDYIVSIVDMGSVTGIAGDKYVMAPIYHLYGAVAAIIFDSPRAGMFLSLGTILALSILLVYSTARLLLSARWAILAAILFAFSSEVLQWSIHLIPTSMGLVFFLGLLFALTKLYYTPELRWFGLVFLFSLAVVFTHQVSTAVILLALGLAAGIAVAVMLRTDEALVRGRRRIAAGLSATFGLTTGITLVSWANTPFSGEFIFLWRMLDVLERQILGEVGFLNLASANGGGGGAGGAPSEGQTGFLGELVPFIEWFGFGLLLAITIVGAMVLLHYFDMPELKLTYLALFGAMFVVVYGLSLFGLRTFMPGRWLAFMHAPMAIIGAVGLAYVAKNAPRQILLIVVIILCLGYPLTMMTAEKATLDAPAFEDEYPRFSHTESEIKAVETLSTYRPPETEPVIGTDHPYRTLYERYGGYTIPDMEVEDGQSVNTPTTVAREYQLQGPATVHQHGDPVVPRQSNAYLTDSLCADVPHHIYTSDTVTICTTAEGGAEI